MEKNLSDSDISKHGINVVVYEDLKDMVSQELYNLMPLAILYQINKNEGHWTLLHKVPEGIEFFDPYGYKPDTEFKELVWQQPHYLAKLLLKLYETIPINYNQYAFQKKIVDVNTCGRWVILRKKLGNLTLDQFAKLIASEAIEQGISTDELVTELVS